ncbi:hypothetical protein [Micromonospora sp. NPDC051296]|uniref:hypothetical protein n=1 Tax=Micromonospora sp. NPDC051296 TaxID=3155046 RepID=UPI0034235573
MVDVGAPVGPRWLLLGDVGLEGSDEIDIPLGLCAAIEGMFVDLPPRPRERFTLVGYLDMLVAHPVEIDLR